MGLWGPTLSLDPQHGDGLIECTDQKTPAKYLNYQDAKALFASYWYACTRPWSCIATNSCQQ